MKAIKDTLGSIQDIQARIARMIENPPSRSECASTPGNSSKTAAPRSTPSSCPYGRCDGSGHLIERHADGTWRYLGDCQCLRDRQLADRMAYARIPREYQGLTINQFRVDLYRDTLTATAARDAAAGFVANFDRFRASGKGLYLWSKTTGSGKTTLAARIGNALIQHNDTPVRFFRVAELFAAIKDTFGGRSDAGLTEHKIVSDAQTVPVLILDDIGSQRDSEWTDRTLYTILNDRADNLRPTIFTSNFSPDDLPAGERTRARIKALSFAVHLPEESIRQQLSDIKDDELGRLLCNPRRQGGQDGHPETDGRAAADGR